jgi:hypothetical protein
VLGRRYGLPVVVAAVSSWGTFLGIRLASAKSALVKSEQLLSLFGLSAALCYVAKLPWRRVFLQIAALALRARATGRRGRPTTCMART